MLIESNVDPPVPMQKAEYTEGELEDKVEELEREVYSLTCTFTSALMQYSYQLKVVQESNHKSEAQLSLQVCSYYIPLRM